MKKTLVALAALASVGTAFAAGHAAAPASSVTLFGIVDAGMTKRGASREQEVAAVSRGLKALALELKIPVFLAAQLNRDAAAPKTKPTKAHLRESGAIEQDADVIILLHTEAEPGDEVIDLDAIVDKNRDGKTGTAEIKGNGIRDKVTWFASFAPFESPRYAVVVMVESGASGGKTCGPVARAIHEHLRARDTGTLRPIARIP